MAAIDFTEKISELPAYDALLGETMAATGLEKDSIEPVVMDITYFELQVALRAFKKSEFNHHRLNLQFHHKSLDLPENKRYLYFDQLKAAEHTFIELQSLLKPGAVGIPFTDRFIIEAAFDLKTLEEVDLGGSYEEAKINYQKIPDGTPEQRIFIIRTWENGFIIRNPFPIHDFLHNEALIPEFNENMMRLAKEQFPEHFAL